MSATTHGNAYFFGVDGTYLGSNAQITSITLRKSDKINAFVENNSGQVVASRHDDQTDELDITFRFMSGYTRPTIAAKVTLAAGGGAQFDGDYRVVSFDETKTAKDFVEGRATLVKDEYLTLT